MGHSAADSLQRLSGLIAPLRQIAFPTFTVHLRDHKNILSKNINIIFLHDTDIQRKIIHKIVDHKENSRNDTLDFQEEIRRKRS